MTSVNPGLSHVSESQSTSGLSIDSEMYSFTSGTIVSARTSSPSMPGTQPVSSNISLAVSRRALTSLVVALLMIGSFVLVQLDLHALLSEGHPPPSSVTTLAFTHLVGTVVRGTDEPNGCYGISCPIRAVQSALMPTNLTTLPHLSVSSTMSLPKSAGESASTSPPRSTMRAFIRGSARAALISLLSLSITSTGVFLGAPMPYQLLAS